MSLLPRAIVYIDGFNLYRRALSGHNEYKWLDLVALSRNLLPDFDVKKIHLFTSHIKPGAFSDPRRVSRQQIYFRALATQSPLLTITLGKFRADARWMAKLPLEINPESGFYQMVKVRKIEEKGSDVNLAIRMVADAFEKSCDISIVLTNDSDQSGPLAMLKNELLHDTGIIFPVPDNRSSKSLTKTNPSIQRFITEELLLNSQLPEKLKDSIGTIVRPKEWR
jgi:hypothetical protein